MTVTLEALLKPGVLGIFRSFDAIEIFATPPNHAPVNLLTVVVAEEAEARIDEEPKLLNSERIKVAMLKGWSFGVKRYRRSLADLQRALDHLSERNEWSASGGALLTARLHAMPHVFVPPDATDIVPLNRVLKNNFWNGSHVLEWGDPEKIYLTPLFDDPRRLQSLSQQIEAVIPIRLASLSDRIGHVIIQVPVKIVMSRFGYDQASGGLSVKVVWAKGATERPLYAVCSTDFDSVLTGAVVAPIIDGQAASPPAGRGQLRGLVWDPNHALAIAASAPLSFFRSINLNMRPIDAEPRTFSAPQPNGASVMQRVSISSISAPSLIGEKHADDIGGWTQKRIYSEEANRLAEQRTFKAYRPTGDPDEDHSVALNDLRTLIGRHGERGAWLWDPYLSASDVINTLFHCPFSDTDLRALSSSEDMLKSKVDFIADQKAIFQVIQGNLRGLKLEFRTRFGDAGWSSERVNDCETAGSRD